MVDNIRIKRKSQYFINSSLYKKIMGEDNILSTQEKDEIKLFLIKKNRGIFTPIWNFFLRNVKWFY